MGDHRHWEFFFSYGWRHSNAHMFGLCGFWGPLWLLWNALFTFHIWIEGRALGEWGNSQGCQWVSQKSFHYLLNALFVKRCTNNKNPFSTFLQCFFILLLLKLDTTSMKPNCWENYSTPAAILPNQNQYLNHPSVGFFQAEGKRKMWCAPRNNWFRKLMIRLIEEEETERVKWRPGVKWQSEMVNIDCPNVSF